MEKVFNKLYFCKFKLLIMKKVFNILYFWKFKFVY